MVLGIFVGASTSVSFAEGSGKEENGRKIKFNVISDSHVGKSETDVSSIYWKESLEDVKKNFLDSKALLHPGDLTIMEVKQSIIHFTKYLNKTYQTILFLCWR